MLVRQRSSMRTRERLRDREAEAGALAGAGRAACETVEQAADELRSDSRASILDRDPQLVVSLLRRDDDRRRAVSQRVRQQVGDDPVERLLVDDRIEVI